MAWFSHIPRHNQMDVLKKVDFKHFIKFKQCSKETVVLTNGFNHRLAMNISWLWFRESRSCKIHTTSTFDIDLEATSAHPIRLKMDKCVINALCSQDGVNVKDFCKNTKITSKMVVFNRDDMEIDVATMDRFINILKSSVLYVHNISSSFLFSLNELKKLKGLHSINGPIEESHFLRLETPVITISEGGLTLPAINKFIKQWLEGKRKIKQLAIDPIPDDHVDVFKDLEFSVLWTKKAPQWEFQIYNDVQTIYSIRREDGRKLAVAMEKWVAVKMLAKEYDELGEVKKWIENFYANAESDSE